ncbi:hypothetical protein TNCV_2429571 [Trichonephila clavipes]|nr:hypothetical protein TNCV_2429571 [Trichonephila clavipes]
MAARLSYECITLSFAIDECRTTGIFSGLHRQLRETVYFHFTRYDTGRRTAVLTPSLEENTLNTVADRLESSTRAYLVLHIS